MTTPNPLGSAANPPMSPEVMRQQQAMFGGAILGAPPGPGGPPPGMPPMAGPMGAPPNMPAPPVPNPSIAHIVSVLNSTADSLASVIPAMELSLPGAIPLLMVMVKAGTGIIDMASKSSQLPSGPGPQDIVPGTQP